MRIYGDVISPFVRACLVCAHETGIADQIELVKTHVKPFEEHPDLFKLSPIGKIPVLETNHHHPVYDSRVIIEYLAHIAGNRDIIPDDGVKRFRALTLAALASGMADAAVALRYEQAQRPEELRWKELMARQQQRIIAGTKDVESNWRPELETVNIGSMFLATTLGYVDFRHQSIDWRKDNQSVAEFYKRFSSRPSMLAYALE